MRLLLLPQQAFAHSFQFTFNYEKSTRWQQTWIRAKVIKFWASLGEYEENELPAVRRKHSFQPIYELLLSTAGILFLFVLQLEIDKNSTVFLTYIGWLSWRQRFARSSGCPVRVGCLQNHSAPARRMSSQLLSFTITCATRKGNRTLRVRWVFEYPATKLGV